MHARCGRTRRSRRWPWVEAWEDVAAGGELGELGGNGICRALPLLLLAKERARVSVASRK